MQEYLDEITGWMEQVRDDDLGVEDYGFLDRVLHGGSKNNGNNGVANVGAYLTIYEKDGELYVDEELVEELDRRQAETDQGGGSRFSNIVYEPTSSKREDNTLYDRGVDGHDKLLTMVEAFMDEADYENAPAPDNEHANNTDESTDEIPDANPREAPVSNGGPKRNPARNGGERHMVTDRELRTDANTRRQMIRAAVWQITDSEQDIEDAIDAAAEAYVAWEEAERDLEETREYLQETLQDDAEMFSYAADALEFYGEALQEGVTGVLEDIDHDDHDLTGVETALRVARRRWDYELPDDPTDLVDNYNP